MSTTLKQKAYQFIHDKLSGGQLPPGSQLSNRGVAKEVGISFTPVREAVSRLVSEGLLEYRQGVGVFVPMSNAQEIREGYELREMLESEAAARVSKNPPSHMLAQMAESYDRMAEIALEISKIEKGADIHEYASDWQEADSDFHLSLLRGTGNRRLLNTINNLKTSLKVMMSGIQESPKIVGHRFSTESRDHIERVLDEHRRILEAIKQGDSDTARSIIAAHLRVGMEVALAAHNRHHMGDIESSFHGPHM